MLNFEPFAGEGLHGEAAAELGPSIVEEAARLVDPSAATETIHWGRNYIYAAETDLANRPTAVVVKQFRNQGWWKATERRIRGSKAERSWRVARELLRVGLATPAPLMWVESDEPEGPSFFVAERLEEAVEVRQFFRRINNEPGEADFPTVDDHEFLARLGRLARRINDSGILYRDLSLGNILAVEENGGLELYLIDFNRARTGRRLGAYRRIRDICRLPVLQNAHREAFLTGYWGQVPSRLSPKWWFYGLSVNAYIWKHALKRAVKPFRFGRRHAHTGGHHPHLPAAEEGASVRDKAVWDHLSDQPHQHATRGEKLAIRLADAPSHLRDAGIILRSAPAVRRRYLDLKHRREKARREFGGVGLALRPWPSDPEGHLEAIDGLGVGPVLLRLHPWEDDHADEERLARALVERGHELSFVLPQNRDLVRDRAAWRDAVERLAETFAPLGRSFQVGQAINRSKWGIWTFQEYIDLYLEAAEILRRQGDVEIMGPSVIDFEFQSVLALVNREHPSLHFDIVSSLLYVDRRGAPENRQMGLDTVDKVTLLRAIAEVGRCSSSRCWITEVNWPLREGPHSPAGKTVSVGEEEQADYLARYFLLALGTGLVERVFWWRLIARGYGLISPDSDGSLRKRPAWHAMKNLIEQVEGSEFLGRLPSPEGVHLYHFDRGGDEVVVGWSVDPGGQGRLPRPAAAALSRDGRTMAPPSGVEVSLAPAPVYYVLCNP